MIIDEKPKLEWAQATFDNLKTNVSTPLGRYRIVGDRDVVYDEFIKE